MNLKQLATSPVGCPLWCARVKHEPTADVHLSEPVQVTTESDRIVVQLEAANGHPPFVTVSHWFAQVDETDTPPGPEPDDMLVMRLATAATVAGQITALIGRALAGPR